MPTFVYYAGVYLLWESLPWRKSYNHEHIDLSWSDKRQSQLWCPTHVTAVISGKRHICDVRYTSQLWCPANVTAVISGTCHICDDRQTSQRWCPAHVTAVLCGTRHRCNFWQTSQLCCPTHVTAVMSGTSWVWQDTTGWAGGRKDEQQLSLFSGSYIFFLQIYYFSNCHKLEPPY